MFKIEKNIAMPDLKVGRASIFPWEEMEVGDSFQIPATKVNSARSSGSHYSTAKTGGQAKFVYRAIKDADGNSVVKDGVVQFRVWRCK
jgi:hypothetical protein